MRTKTFFVIALLYSFALLGLTSCLGNNDPEVDEAWRDANVAFYSQQAELRNPDGSKYYQAVAAPWDSSAQVLMHWFNDRSLTSGNLKPLYTSTVDVKYKLMLYNGVALDSSYNRTEPADSVFRTKLNAGGIITGWGIAIPQMHVGDSCRVVIPYSQGYGMNDYHNIKGYTTLVFDIKLVDIPAYENK